MKKITRLAFILLMGCLIATAPALFAARAKKGKSHTSLSKKMFNSKGPIHIISNRLDADNKKHLITFAGHVVVKRSTLTLTCDRLDVYYSQKAGQIDKIISSGHVIIKQPPKSATCNKAIFIQKNNKVVLFGNPILSEGKNKVTGEKVTFFLDSEKTIIEGGKKGRVTTTIVPRSSTLPFKAKQ